MSEGKLTMFGKTYNTVGSSDSNLLLKTKGDLKVLWGGKFIDILKNGKLASTSLDILNIIDSPDNINKNGIYLIPSEEGGLVWIYIDGNKVLLDTNLNLYISFLEEQLLTSELKDVALVNIGFNYNTLEDAQKANIKAGLIFIKDKGQLFIVKDGTITEYKPLDSEKTNFLELTIGKIKIYESTISSISNSLSIGIGSSNYVLLEENRTLITGDLVINSGEIRSIGANSTHGFRAYILNGKSVFEVDRIIVRDQADLPDKYINVLVRLFRDLIKNSSLIPGAEYRLYNFRNFWQLTEPEITMFDTIPETVINTFNIIVKAKNNSEYYSDKCFFEDDLSYTFTYDVFYDKLYTVGDYTSPALGLITRMKDSNGNECNYNFRHLLFLYKDLWYYTFGYDSKLYKNNVINLSDIRVEAFVNGEVIVFENRKNYAILTHPCEGNIFNNQTSPLYVKENFNRNTVIGNWNPKSNNSIISDCLFKKDVIGVEFIKCTLEECTFDYTILSTDLFFELIFKKCIFLSLLATNILIPDDTIKASLKSNEPKLVTVYIDKGINKLKVVSNSSLSTPAGVIVMWSGIEVPYGWAICNGENGTPNLINKFIKAVETVELVGDNTSELNENNELTIKLENLPKHSHSHLPHTHQLNLEGGGEILETDNSEELDIPLLWHDYNYGIEGVNKLVVTEVTGNNIVPKIETIVGVSNIKTLGGSAIGGIHTHTFSINSISAGSLLEATSLEEIPLDSEWPNKAIKIEPRSYSLMFIMKL